MYRYVKIFLAKTDGGIFEMCTDDADIRQSET